MFVCKVLCWPCDGDNTCVKVREEALGTAQCSPCQTPFQPFHPSTRLMVSVVCVSCVCDEEQIRLAGKQIHAVFGI